MSLDVTSLIKAINQLESALDAYYELIQEKPKYKIHMRGAVIQAFEFTYELTLKMLKRHLYTSLFNPHEVDSMSFKHIIREAYAKNLTNSDVVVWTEYRKNRGITSHTYDEVKAQAVFESVSKFLNEARYVLARLQEIQHAPPITTQSNTKNSKLENKISKSKSKIKKHTSKIKSNKGIKFDSAKKRSIKI